MGVFGGGARWRGVLALGLAAAVAVLAFGVSRGARVTPADFAFTNGGEVTSLDPHVVSGVPESRIARALFEGLLTRDARTRVLTPATAESWGYSPDGRKYRFTLRANCTWSNGDPLTAEDFVWSFRRLLEPATASPNSALLWPIEGAREFAQAPAGTGDWSRVAIRAPDPVTLELSLAEPVPYFALVLASYPFVPVHRASVEAAERDGGRSWTTPTELVCNGPYRLLEHRLNDRIRLTKNARYWDAANVAFETIDALAVESWTTALNLYLTGAVDWVDGSIPTSAVPELLGRADFKVIAYQGLYFYRLNTTEPPCDDVRVRRALSLALDRQRVCELVLKAGQQPAVGFVPWGSIGAYTGPRLPEQDEVLARKLLAEAGYGAQGKPFPPLSIHFHTSEVHRDIAEVIAAQWRDVLGIEVRLANQEWKVFLDAQKSLAYQVSRLSWIADFEDPASFLGIWVSGSENNRTGWSNARYDELIEKGATELDLARRGTYYFEAEKILFDELPAIPIYAYVSQNLVSPLLDGFVPNTLNDFFPRPGVGRTSRSSSASVLGACTCSTRRRTGPTCESRPSARASRRKKPPRPRSRRRRRNDAARTMTRFLLRRAAWFALTAWAVITLAFFLMRAVPGGPFSSERALPPSVEAHINARYHLDWPMWKQYLHTLGPLNLDEHGSLGDGTRTFGGILAGDLGPSFKYRDQSVNDVIAESLPISIALGSVALVFALVLGLTAGIVAALRPGSWIDLALRATATIGVAVPNFVVAGVLILVFAFQLRIAPVAGWGSLGHLVLPGIALGFPFAAHIARLLRTSLLETLSQDYIRTAAAKGAPRWRVVAVHALKGALLPVVSFLGPASAGVLTGSLVIERIFAIPGTGSHFVASALNRDYTLAMGVALLYTVMVFALNTLVDVVHTLLDPRIELEG